MWSACCKKNYPLLDQIVYPGPGRITFTAQSQSQALLHQFSPEFGYHSWLAPNDHLRDFEFRRYDNYLTRIGHHMKEYNDLKLCWLCNDNNFLSVFAMVFFENYWRKVLVKCKANNWCLISWAQARMFRPSWCCHYNFSEYCLTVHATVNQMGLASIPKVLWQLLFVPLLPLYWNGIQSTFLFMLTM